MLLLLFTKSSDDCCESDIGDACGKQAWYSTGLRFMFCGEVTSLAGCVQIVVGAIWTLIERSPLKRDGPAGLLSSTLTSVPTVGT